MTRKEAEKLYIGAWVEDKKTREGFDVYGIRKQNDNIFILDKNDLCHPYKTLNYIFREETEYYNYVLGYNFTRKRWLFDAKTYLDPDDWYWKWNWNHKYARELTRREISIMRSIAKENPDKKYVIPDKFYPDCGAKMSEIPTGSDDELYSDCIDAFKEYALGRKRGQ